LYLHVKKYFYCVSILILSIFILAAFSSCKETSVEGLEKEVVGEYTLRTSASEKLYSFDFKTDKTISIEEMYTDSGKGFTVSGRWKIAESTIEITVNKINDEIPPEETILVIRFEDGFPYGIDIIKGNITENLEITEFSLGSGDSHSLLEELNRRLEAVDYLEYQADEEDMSTYTEYLRKTVARFQESQGIVANGVVDIETWRALKDPEPPIIYQEPAEKPGEADYGDPDVDTKEKTGAGENILYFTFDDGPHPEYSQKIMEEFARYDGSATFFVLGAQMENYPDTLRQMIIEGHYIGNHTNSHTSFEGISREQFMDEIETVENIFIEAAGDLIVPDKVVRYMRPPYGATDANTRAYAAELGYHVVLWDIDTQDWRRPGAEQIAGVILDNAYPGAIILMHDGGGDRNQTIEALEIALPELDKRGYVFRNIYSIDLESGS